MGRRFSFGIAMLVFSFLMAGYLQASSRYAYTVCNGNFTDQRIRVIDTSTDTVVKVLDAFPYYSSPSGMAVSPDGHYLYVTDEGAKVIWRYDLNNNYDRTSISGSALANHPRRIAITPDSREAYVANAWGKEVVAVDLVNKTILTTIPVNTGPVDIAMASDGKSAAVLINGCGFGSGSVVRMIDTLKDIPLPKSAPLSRAPQRIIFPLFWNRIYALESSCLTTDYQPGIVHVINADTFEEITTLYTNQDHNHPNQSRDMAITPDESLLYVANNADNTVSFFELDNENTLNFVAGDFARPAGVGAHPDGERVYVADRNGIHVVSTHTNAVIRSMQGGGEGDRCFFAFSPKDDEKK